MRFFVPYEKVLYPHTAEFAVLLKQQIVTLLTMSYTLNTIIQNHEYCVI